ncbi:TPA: hypothetical protein ACX6RL_003339 [Photobacterium damselae]
MRKSLFVGVCATSDDFFKYKNSLVKSFSSLNNAFNGDCFFYLVIQGEKSEEVNFTSEEIDYYVEYESFLGVSNARNLCIKKAVDIDAKYILFHDASICWTNDAADYIYIYKNKTPKVNISFSNDIKEFYNFILNGRKRKVNPIYDAYIWSYLFKLEDVSNLKFDLNFGPGQSTYYKSGEDVLFLFDVFNRRKSYDVYESNKKVIIYHPPRDTNLSKHLIYAKGQGKIFQILLSRYFSLFILKDIILFFGNAIFRCLLLKKNSFKILLQRVSGFFS